MAMINMTTGDVAAAAQRDAEERAAALSKAFSQGVDAEAYRLGGNWYVVTSGTGEGYDFAYDASDVVIADVSAEGWDYSAWCSGVSPDEDLTIAVEYYMQTGRRLGTAGSCTSILSDEQIAVLDIARAM